MLEKGSTQPSVKNGDFPGYQCERALKEEKKGCPRKKAVDHLWKVSDWLKIPKVFAKGRLRETCGDTNPRFHDDALNWGGRTPQRRILLRFWERPLCSHACLFCKAWCPILVEYVMRFMMQCYVMHDYLCNVDAWSGFWLDCMVGNFWRLRTLGTCNHWVYQFGPVFSAEGFIGCV